MPALEFSQLTDVGCIREENEDAVASWELGDGVLFAVADGLGGYAAGEVASALALEVLHDETEKAPKTWALAKTLRRAVQEANLRLYERTMTVTELRGMATTLTATAVTGASLTTVHVGDCRLLLLRDGALTQLTKDHTWVAEQMQYGLLSAEQARIHPRRHILTRCLGRELIVGIDVLTLPVRRGDVLIQCSDGMHGTVDDQEIIAIVGDDPDASCRALVERARAAGAPDNVSVQIAAVRECDDAEPPRRWWQRRR
jgi:serine/threonine protein phosphatase PrpC